MFTSEVVGNSELYPLNSLMLHGIIYARHAHGLNYDTNNIFKSEMRAMFRQRHAAAGNVHHARSC